MEDLESNLLKLFSNYENTRLSFQNYIDLVKECIDEYIYNIKTNDNDQIEVNNLFIHFKYFIDICYRLNIYMLLTKNPTYTDSFIYFKLYNKIKELIKKMDEIYIDNAEKYTLFKNNIVNKDMIKKIIIPFNEFFETSYYYINNVTYIYLKKIYLNFGKSKLLPDIKTIEDVNDYIINNITPIKNNFNDLYKSLTDDYKKNINILLTYFDDFEKIIQDSKYIKLITEINNYKDDLFNEQFIMNKYKRTKKIIKLKTTFNEEIINKFINAMYPIMIEIINYLNIITLINE